jgi:hypothetical protein
MFEETEAAWQAAYRAGWEARGKKDVACCNDWWGPSWIGSTRTITTGDFDKLVEAIAAEEVLGE